MIGFDAVTGGYVARLEDFEVELLSSLVEQVNELLGAGRDADADDDPFAQWEDEFAPSARLDRSDPVVRRLFPDASADEQLAAEHRRLTEETQRRERIAEGELVLTDLAAVDDGLLFVERDHADAWLKTLNAVRLSLSVRLGIETDRDVAEVHALPRSDPRFHLGMLFDWLGLVLESLVDVVGD